MATNIDDLPVNDALKETMRRTEANLRKRWEQEAEDSKKVYVIDLPQQTVVIGDEAWGKYTLKTLKACGVHGTYRLTERGPE